jgi:phosphatidylglycerol:prolipoprotein diacylglycerol transferase
MFPVVFDLGTWNLPLLGETPVFLPTYGLLFATSVLIAWAWFGRRARQIGIADDRVFNLCFYTLLGGIIGAKALLIVVDWRVYLNHPAEILGTLRSAGVLLGGVIGGGLTFAYYARRHDLPLPGLADALVAPLSLAQALGRLGCFCAGCCWGAEVDPGHPLAVTFTNPVASAQTGVPLNRPLMSVQLIQLAFDLTLAIVLTILWRRRPAHVGMVFWTYIGLYGIGRFVIEFWRGDSHRGIFFGGALSTSQLLSLVGVIFAVVALVRGRRAAAR